ncbi:MAG TPA: choice-of-anchor X domain-containing protein [Nitrospira sp.]
MTVTAFITSTEGATFSEVLVALVLTMVGVLGAMGAFQAAGSGISQGALVTRALAMAESRIEAKRSVSWDLILMDDLDHDGTMETSMRDDGAGGDRSAGDGIYSASREQDGVSLTWMVSPNRPGHVLDSGFVIIEARASYQWGEGRREVRLATVRANPNVSGSY